MGRWAAIGLGCLTALGMQALFGFVAATLGVASSALVFYAAMFVALGLGGYVTGHFARQVPALYGAFAAVAYILVAVTISAVREVDVARQYGLGALAPIDFLQLTLTDVIAMTGGSMGGWLAGRT
jgi:hypothetical protein